MYNYVTLRGCVYSLCVHCVCRSIGLIKKILPEKFWHVKGIENQVAKVRRHTQFRASWGVYAYIHTFIGLSLFEDV